MALKAEKLSVYVAGQYPDSPLRHRSENLETYQDLLQKHAFTISDDPLNADLFLALDFSLRDSTILTARKSKGNINILFRSEPRCVIPAAYRPKNLKNFDAVLSFGAKSHVPDRENWPQFWPSQEITLENMGERSEKLVIVNANKISLNPTEMYSLRRNCMRDLSILQSYGEGWNRNFKIKFKTLIIEIRKNPMANIFRYPSHGKYWFKKWPEIESPVDKQTVLRKHKYSLVIENDSDYMSEKLFDALFAGCLPIYVGPPTRDYGIPEDLVVQAEASVAGVMIAYQKAKQVDYADFVKRLQAWLSNQETRDAHSGESVFMRSLYYLASAYESHLTQSLHRT